MNLQCMRAGTAVCTFLVAPQVLYSFTYRKDTSAQTRPDQPLRLYLGNLSLSHSHRHGNTHDAQPISLYIVNRLTTAYVNLQYVLHD